MNDHINRCESYHPGHQVHWIHAKRGQEDSAHVGCHVVVADEHVLLLGRFHQSAGVIATAWWTHDPDRLRKIVDRGLPCSVLPGLHLLRVGTFLFNLAVPGTERGCNVSSQTLDVLL